MFCQQCGTQIEEGMAFCTTCGAKQVATTTAPVNNEVINNPQPQPAMNVQYVQPNNQFHQPINQQGYAQPNNQFNQPINQQGYAQPNNYSWANTNIAAKKVSFGEAIKLFFINYVNFKGRATKEEYWWAFLFNFLVSLLTSWIPVVGQLIALALLLPGISVGVRRLHDTGKSWVYLLMGLIPIAGFIILIVQYCKDSDADNAWGPTPR